MEIENIELDGGILILDFINTVHNRLESPLRDYLTDEYKLAQWGVKVGILSESEQHELVQNINTAPLSVTPKLASILEMREFLYQMFYHLSVDSPLSEKTLKTFTDYIKNSSKNMAIIAGDNGYHKSCSFDATSFSKIIFTVLESALTLLTTGNHHRIKECPSCGWLFLDTTKNGRRKWCSMKSCGNNVKALQWYYRHKEN